MRLMRAWRRSGVARDMWLESFSRERKDQDRRAPLGSSVDGLKRKNPAMQRKESGAKRNVLIIGGANRLLQILLHFCD